MYIKYSIFDREHVDNIAPAILGGIIAGGSALLGGGISSAINYFSNKQTNETNQDIAASNNALQMDMAKNAYSYAVADKLRAGLSPLDTDAMTVPALQNPEQRAYQQSDFVGSAAQNAVDSFLNSKRYELERDLNNAQVAKLQSETAGQSLDNSLALATLSSKISEAQERLNSLKTSNAYQSQEKELALKRLGAEYDNLIAQYNNISQQTANLRSMAPVEMWNTYQSSRLSNAKVATENITRAQGIQNLIDAMHNSDWYRYNNLPTDASVSSSSLLTSIFSSSHALRGLQYNFSFDDKKLAMETFDLAIREGRAKRLIGRALYDYAINEVQKALIYAPQF